MSASGMTQNDAKPQQEHWKETYTQDVVELGLARHFVGW